MKAKHSERKSNRVWLWSSVTVCMGLICVLAVLMLNGTFKVQEGRLNSSNIKRFFKGIFISEKIGFVKPQKEFFDNVFKDLDNEKIDRKTYEDKLLSFSTKLTKINSVVDDIYS